MGGALPASGIRHISGSDSSYLPDLASASHFFMNEAFAAPASGFPSLLTAFSAHPDPAAAPTLASASHFLMKEAFAAPAKGFPSLVTALDSQSDAAVATCANNILAANRQAINLDMVVVLPRSWIGRSAAITIAQHDHAHFPCDAETGGHGSHLSG